MLAYVLDFHENRTPKADQGKEFRNSLDKEMTELLGIKRHFTTLYHPQVLLILYLII